MPTAVRHWRTRPLVTILVPLASWTGVGTSSRLLSPLVPSGRSFRRGLASVGSRRRCGTAQTAVLPDRLENLDGIASHPDSSGARDPPGSAPCGSAPYGGKNARTQPRAKLPSQLYLQESVVDDHEGGTALLDPQAADGHPVDPAARRGAPSIRWSCRRGVPSGHRVPRSLPRPLRRCLPGNLLRRQDHRQERLEPLKKHSAVSLACLQRQMAPTKLPPDPVLPLRLAA